ncbi:MAG: hypothetical protein JOY71_27950 [Acetobacteraceae bacterium]|nr:hypothetical protein [Acetobacteraceae bacterium]MBV8592653.1 hypothetical protein [Acetobacteraceae bacterium]
MPPIDGPNLDSEQLARDWLTISKSELACMQVDREAYEAWHTLSALWAGAAALILHRHSEQGEADASRSTSAATATRPAPAADAPDPRDAEIERLRRRIAELEAERRGGTAGEPGAAAA